MHVVKQHACNIHEVGLWPKILILISLFLAVTNFFILLFIALMAVANILPFDKLIFPFLSASTTSASVRLLFALAVQVSVNALVQLEVVGC